jgi:RNA polymerase sigma-70 factor, ECF subfamily
LLSFRGLDGRFALLRRRGSVRHYYNDGWRRKKVTVDEQDWLVQRFEEHRSHLRAVAYRMLGSPGEADDAVQEAWLRLSRSDTDDIENLGGWLTTVVSRVCLDALRSRRSRREEPLEESSGKLPVTRSPEPIVGRDRDGGDPEREVLVADSLGPALLAVLETMSPAERVAFVLHDVFGMPFGEIAPIVGRSPAAAKMLASRARRRVRGGAATPSANLTRQREVVDAFLAASRDGDFGALLAVLDPDVVLRADRAAVDSAASRQASGAPPLAPEVRGAFAVAEVFSGRAGAARPALVNGAAGAVWAPGGRPRAVFGFTIRRGKIVGIDILYDPERIRRLDLAVLND